MRILVTILLCLWMNVGYAAPNWEAVNERGFMVDTTSIKVIQVDYNEIVKANAKDPMRDGGYGLYTVMINRDTKEYCFSVMEFYRADGTLESKHTMNPKNPHSWMVGNKEINDEILKRVP